jgi:DNA-binding response OmpR family regulator
MRRTASRASVTLSGTTQTTETTERRAMADANVARAVILNVDDNEGARSMVTLLLQNAGFIVIEADSGYAALEQVELHHPDLLVLDIRLPDIDGIEVCRRLRETSHGKSMKVLHTSATFVTTDAKVQSLDGGADGYLAQPFEPQELLATVRALLRLNQTEQELRDGAARLRDADRRKNEFLAMLAHELRNPLAAMSASLPLIDRRAPMDEVERRARAVIGRQIVHLGRLVDDLLDVSRVTQGKIELKWEVIDLCTLLTRVAANAEQTKTGNRRQQLRMTLPSKPVFLRADGTRLDQIFTNLIDNASKYSDNGSSLHISLETRRGFDGVGKDTAIVRVHDNGIGIAPDVLPRLFTLFSQADVPISRSRGGLGIGLTLVRTLVELHGGTVVAKSDGLGRGSEFQVTLPSLPEQDRSSEVSALAAQKKSGSSRKVLVIEDNSDAQQVMKDLLELWGHDVVCASDGVSGVNELWSFAPEVALVDIGLPGIDGYEVARQVRAKPAGKDVLLVALTGYGAPEQRTAAIEAGFDLHLVKPVDPERLATLLKQPPARRATGAPTQPASK